MPNFKNNRGFNMKAKGNFDFGNKGIYDIKTETKDQSVVEADKSTGKKSIFKKYGKSPMKQDKKQKVTPGKENKPKYSLKVGTLVGGGKEYFKVDEKGANIKISEATYNSLKGQ
jgi:hypothetical protein